MQNHKLTELLSRDSESREFFSSLPTGLRKRLVKQDIGCFEALKGSADFYSPEPVTAPNNDFYSPSVSAMECTGLIPDGSDLSEDKWRSFNELHQFGGPVTGQS